MTWCLFRWGLVFNQEKTAHDRLHQQFKSDLPIGLGTASTWLQSKGKLFKDHTTGWFRWDKFKETAIKAHVSWRMAKRLDKMMMDFMSKETLQNSCKILTINK